MFAKFINNTQIQPLGKTVQLSTGNLISNPAFYFSKNPKLALSEGWLIVEQEERPVTVYPQYLTIQYKQVDDKIVESYIINELDTKRLKIFVDKENYANSRIHKAWQNEDGSIDYDVVPVDISSLSPESQGEFGKVIQTIIETGGGVWVADFGIIELQGGNLVSEFIVTEEGVSANKESKVFVSFPESSIIIWEEIFDLKIRNK